MAKKRLNYQFLPIFVIKDQLKTKNGSNKSKFHSHNVWGNIVLHIQAKYRKDRMKTGGAYSILKKGWKTDTNRRTDGSASKKLCWLCQQRSWKDKDEK